MKMKSQIVTTKTWRGWLIEVDTGRTQWWSLYTRPLLYAAGVNYTDDPKKVQVINGGNVTNEEYLFTCWFPTESQVTGHIYTEFRGD